MNKLLIPVLCLLVLATSCKKDKDSDTNASADNSFEVKLNGQAISFTVETATLLRSTVTNEKRLDITAQSKDGNKKITLTFGENTDQGNGIAVKTYKIQMFNDDDPNTAADESEDNMDGFITYGNKSGNNWIYQIYAEKGTFTVTSCNTTSKKISGTFKISLVNLNDENDKVEFTDGKFTNVTYMVLN